MQLFITFCLLKKIGQSTHSGTFHCPGMDLARTRDISFHSGTVPGNPGHLVTLNCLYIHNDAIQVV